MAGIEDLKSRMILKNGMAFSNQFSVQLPTTVGIGSETGSKELKGIDSKTANILCKSVTMPGKQILTVDRQIGIFNEKVVNGFAVDDVTMTFYVLNDYGIKYYFDNWRKCMINEDPYTDKETVDTLSNKLGTVAYKNEYQGVVKIHQLRKPIFRTGFDIGPISLDLDLFAASIYSVELIDAFPTTINSIELSNEADGLVEVSVQFSFTNWRVIEDKRGLANLSANLSGGII